MLYWLGGEFAEDGWSPGIGVVTTLGENHLDWHGTLEHYVQCKANIFRFQSGSDLAVLGEGIDISASASRLVSMDEQREVISEDVISLRLPGRHNQRNARCALCVVEEVIGLDERAGRAALGDFVGLPHRLELVAEDPEHRRFYNDSKSTTPESSVLAVDSFEESGKVHLIAGGYDKGLDLRPIADLASRLAGLYAIGETGPGLVCLALEKTDESNVLICRTLDKAVESAVARMGPCDVLLLSPGCASWDQVENYEERGGRFSELVRRVVEHQKRINHRGHREDTEVF